MSIKDGRNLKNQSENNDDNNKGENNSNNTNLVQTLVFQVDTGKKVVWNSRKLSSRKTFFKSVLYYYLFDWSSTFLLLCFCYFLGGFSCSQWFCTFVRYPFIAVNSYHVKVAVVFPLWNILLILSSLLCLHVATLHVQEQGNQWMNKVYLVSPS